MKKKKSGRKLQPLHSEGYSMPLDLCHNYKPLGGNFEHQAPAIRLCCANSHLWKGYTEIEVKEFPVFDVLAPVFFQLAPTLSIAMKLQSGKNTSSRYGYHEHAQKLKWN